MNLWQFQFMIIAIGMSKIIV